MFPLHKNIYHYTRSDIALKNILSDMSIRLGPMHLVNDPKESKKWPFKFYTRELSSNSNFNYRLFKNVNHYIIKRSLMFCGTMDSSSLQMKNNYMPDHTKRGYGHSRMWAQYSENHKGVCFAFDKDKLHQAIIATLGNDKLFFGEVNYVASEFGHIVQDGIDPFGITYLEDVIEKGIDQIFEPIIKKFNQEFYFKKHIDWQDEWEYRWVYRSANDTPIYIPIEGCLNAVILGNDCPQEIADSIILFCKEKRIPVYKIHWYGWAVALFGDLTNDDFNKQTLVSLDGISFNVNIPCAGVIVQGLDKEGNEQPILINTNGEAISLSTQ